MISVHNIKKSYPNGMEERYVLNDISFTIQKAQMVALSGPSGSGKSTLLNICGLLDLTYEGDVLFDSKPISKNEQVLLEFRRKNLGFVFQRFNLIPVMTAFENIEYPLILNGIGQTQRKQKVFDLLDQVGLKGFENKRPLQLSGGQQQRVAIARALIHEPELIIADEPTANLDSETAIQIMQLMQSLGKQNGTTILIASHDDVVKTHCEYLLHLKDGRLET